MEYASNGKGTAGLTLGIIGTGLSVLNGGLGGILGGGAGDGYVSKEVLDLSMKLARSENENAILASDLTVEKKFAEMYSVLNDKISKVENDQIAVNSAQSVTNSVVASQLAVMNTNLSQLMSLTKVGIPNSSLFTATS